MDGKFLDILGTQRNIIPSSHIYDEFHYKFNEKKISL